MLEKKNQVEVEETLYMKKIRTILNHSIRQFEEGKSFPIWGTCLGFESMLVSYFNYTIRVATKLQDFRVIF